MSPELSLFLLQKIRAFIERQLIANMGVGMALFLCSKPGDDPVEI